MKTTGLDLQTFFKQEQIDVFAVVDTADLPDVDRADVLQFFPASRSVIVFGKEVPVDLYRMSPGEKTCGMLRIAEALDESAFLLARILNDERIPAVSVPLYLPVKMKGGQVQGVIRLKNTAAAGRLGAIGKKFCPSHTRVRSTIIIERSSYLQAVKGLLTRRKSRERNEPCRLRALHRV